ncbi:MAG: hypothetical protein IKM95_01815 [Bacteroidales bacterium]|nr:hypothetical protein [Bacteroidales bacterium]
MKKLFVLAALAIMMVACGGGNKPYDAKKVNDLTERMFSLTAADYPEVVKQADGILTYFEQNYPADELKEKGHGLVTDGLFGKDTELFKQMNQLSNVLYGMEDQMDAATQEAYKKYQEHQDKVFGSF